MTRNTDVICRAVKMSDGCEGSPLMARTRVSSAARDFDFGELVFRVRARI